MNVIIFLGIGFTAGFLVALALIAIIMRKDTEGTLYLDASTGMYGCAFRRSLDMIPTKQKWAVMRIEWRTINREKSSSLNG